MIRRTESFSYEDRLRQLCLFSLEKRGLWGDLTAAFQYLKRAHRQEGNQLSIQVDRNRTWGNDFKLKERRFRWDVRGKFSLFTESAEVLEQATQGGG